MQLLDFIVCDDIRFEMGNKMSVMGIYDDSVLLSPPKDGSEMQWPLPMRLSFFIRIYPDAKDPAASGFDFVVLHEGQKIASIGGEIAVRDTGKPLRLAISFVQLPIPSTGKLSFKVMLRKGSEVISEHSAPRGITVGLLGAEQASA